MDQIPYSEGLRHYLFYERDILEGDSPRTVLTDLEQSLLEKTSTSLVCSIIYKHVDISPCLLHSHRILAHEFPHIKLFTRPFSCDAQCPVSVVDGGGGVAKALSIYLPV